jgi:pimeloyl-ACP methyl ester carboxylesterase
MLAVGCGGNGDRASDGERKEPRRFVFSPGEGKPIDIGDDRSLRMLCAGSGTPTVVVSAGLIDRSSAIRDQLAQTARTCAYDSAGNGYSSERLPNGSGLQDLEKLLRAAHLPAPYVLVGLSVESPVVSLFAKAHPDQTAGVVLVEGVGANWRPRFLALGRGQPAGVRRRLRRDVGPPFADGVDWNAVGSDAASVRTLGRTPLAVVSTTRPPLSTQAELPAALRRAAARLHMTQQDELAALSSNHVHVVATRTDEFVMDTQPAVVVRGVREVVRAAESGKPLPPCAQVFRGAGVSCRG